MSSSEIVKFVNYSKTSVLIIDGDDGIDQGLLELLETTDNTVLNTAETLPSTDFENGIDLKEKTTESLIPTAMSSTTSPMDIKINQASADSLITSPPETSMDQATANPMDQVTTIPMGQATTTPMNEVTTTPMDQATTTPMDKATTTPMGVTFSDGLPATEINLPSIVEAGASSENMLNGSAADILEIITLPPDDTSTLIVTIAITSTSPLLITITDSTQLMQSTTLSSIESNTNTGSVASTTTSSRKKRSIDRKDLEKIILEMNVLESKILSPNDTISVDGKKLLVEKFKKFVTTYCKDPSKDPHIKFSKYIYSDRANRKSSKAMLK